MRGANKNRRKYSRRALKQEAAGPPRQKGPDPRNEKMVYPLCAQGAAEDVGINIIKTALDVKEQ